MGRKSCGFRLKSLNLALKFLYIARFSLLWSSSRLPICKYSIHNNNTMRITINIIKSIANTEWNKQASTIFRINPSLPTYNLFPLNKKILRIVSNKVLKEGLILRFRPQSWDFFPAISATKSKFFDSLQQQLRPHRLHFSAILRITIATAKHNLKLCL